MPNYPRNPEEDRLAALLRRVGSRPAPPEQAREEVRAAVRETWLAEVRRIRTRRRAHYAVAASLVVAAAIAWLATTPGKSDVPVATIDHLVNEVEYRSPSGDWLPLRINARIGEVALRTGHNSLLSMQTVDGNNVRVAADSLVQIADARDLTLDAGAIYVDTGSRSGATIVVTTRYGRALDLGTRFEVRVDADAWRVQVRDGAVRMVAADAQNVARAGERISIGSDGVVETSLVAKDDVSWAWTQAAAAPFDIEGATLEEYLSWVSLETGETLSFRHDIAEREAKRTILHGSINGLTPRESLSAVLSTTDFRLLESGAGTILVDK
jgi:ferric-dicitrate binding protein FerR (iron transport regulator)